MSDFDPAQSNAEGQPASANLGEGDLGSLLYEQQWGEQDPVAPDDTGTQQTEAEGGDDLSQQAGESLTPGEPQDADPEKKALGPVPYEVYQKANHGQREAEKLVADWQRAANLGYSDVEVMRQHEALAKEAGYPSLEAGIAWQKDQQALRDYATQLSERVGLTDEDREEMFSAKQLALDAKRDLAISRENNKATQTTLQSQAISAIERDLGPLDEDLKAHLGTLPASDIQKWHAPLKRQMESYADGEVSRSVDRRRQNQRQPAPIGAGGAPARVQTQPADFKTNATRRLADVLQMPANFG